MPARGSCALTLSEVEAVRLLCAENMLTSNASILECRSNPSSHSRVGDRLVRFRVTDQEARVAAQ